jgi:hypothetical protein
MISGTQQATFRDLELKNWDSGYPNYNKETLIANGHSGDMSMNGTLNVGTINHANGVNIEGVTIQNNYVTISGSLTLNNTDVSGKLTQIDASLVDLASNSGGGGPDVLSLKLNQRWDIGTYTFPWEVGSRLGPDFTSNPYDIIGTAPSSLYIGDDYLITANTAGIYKFEIAANYRWYGGCTFNNTLWICIRNGYTLSGYTSGALVGYDCVHSTHRQQRIVAPPNDWSIPEYFLFTVEMAAGDRIMHAHERLVNGASMMSGGGQSKAWPYTVTVTKVG